MNFEQVLRKFIRFPWLPVTERDEDVLRSVQSRCGGFEHFRETPDPRILQAVLHSCAIPIIQTQHMTRSPSTMERNRWGTLTPEEQKFVLDTLALNPRQHTSMLHLGIDHATNVRISYYVAASFALTTYTKPYLLHFDNLVQMALTSAQGDSFELADARMSGLLILMGTGGSVMGAEKVCGFLASLLRQRQHRGMTHAFLDVPDGEVLTKMMRNKLVSLEDVMKMYQSIFTPAMRMQAMMFGPNVYINPITRLENAGNERRQATVI